MKVIGYHGTTAKARVRIQTTGPQTIALNARPKWLGTGFYFFQDAPLAAAKWAAEISARRAGDTPMVYQATIDLSDAIDLTDIGYWTMFADIKPTLGIPDRTQLGPEALFRDLSSAERDQLYYNYEDDYYMSAFVAKLENEGHQIKAIRAAFIEGSPVHARSWLFDRSHVQVCVRYPEIITDPQWLDL